MSHSGFLAKKLLAGLLLAIIAFTAFTPSQTFAQDCAQIKSTFDEKFLGSLDEFRERFNPETAQLVEKFKNTNSANSTELARIEDELRNLTITMRQNIIEAIAATNQAGASGCISSSSYQQAVTQLQRDVRAFNNSHLQTEISSAGSGGQLGGIPKVIKFSDFAAPINYTPATYSDSDTTQADCDVIIARAQQQEANAKIFIARAKNDVGLLRENQQRADQELGAATNAILSLHATLQEAQEKGCDKTHAAEYQRLVASRGSLLSALNEVEVELGRTRTSLTSQAVNAVNDAFNRLLDYFDCKQCEDAKVQQTFLQDFFKPFCCLFWQFVDALRDFAVTLSNAIQAQLDNL